MEYSTFKEEDIFTSMESLEVEEARLTEQKENLTALFNQLQTKVKEEFKKRKRKVDELNSEILDLKEKCDKLAKLVSLINEGSTQERSQTTRLEDKDVDVREPYQNKVLQAVPEGVRKTPTDDDKIVVEWQNNKAKRNKFLGSL